MTLRDEIQRVLAEEHDRRAQALNRATTYMEEQKLRLEAWRPVLAEMEAAFASDYLKFEMSGLQVRIKATRRPPLPQLRLEIMAQASYEAALAPTAKPGFLVTVGNYLDSGLYEKQHAFPDLPSAAEFCIRDVAKWLALFDPPKKS